MNGERRRPWPLPNGLSAIPASCQAGLRAQGIGRAPGSGSTSRSRRDDLSVQAWTDQPSEREIRVRPKTASWCQGPGAVRGTGPGRHPHPPLVSGTCVHSTGHARVPGEGLASAPSPEASQPPSPMSCQRRAGNHCKVISPSNDAAHHVF